MDIQQSLECRLACYGGNSSVLVSPHCFLQGMYGIENEVFLSLPCVLGFAGLTSVINQKLRDNEVAQLQKSAATLWSIQKDLKDL